MEINKERFEAFLYSQPRDIVVNIGDQRDCLLCRFFRETTNTPIWAGVEVFFARNNPTVTYYPIPDWFQSVVNVDSITRDDGKLTMGQLQDAFRKVFPLEPEPEPVKVKIPFDETILSWSSWNV